MAAVRNGQAGFSLIELILAVTLFAVVTGAIYGLLSVARRDRTTSTQRVDIMNTLRASMTYIGRDALNAGLSYPVTLNPVLVRNGRVNALTGAPPDADAARDFLPPVLAGPNVNANNLSGVNTDQITFAYRDTTFNIVVNGGVSVPRPLTISSVTTQNGIDEIVPVIGGVDVNTICAPNDLYIVSGQNSTVLAVVTALDGTDTIQFAGGDPLGINTPGAGNPLRNITGSASIKKIRLVTFRVLADGTLVRTEYANGVPGGLSQDEPLAYGVESMEVRYVMKNGTITDNPPNQTDVRQVRVTLIARSTVLDQRGQPYRVTLTSTFSTRNLGYDAG
jgi:prepilin-type N-terminal cleavage/methylation domain-containing protein